MTSSEKINNEVETHLKIYKGAYGPTFKGMVRMNLELPKDLTGLDISDAKQLEKMQKLATDDYEKNKDKYNLYLNE